MLLALPMLVLQSRSSEAATPSAQPELHARAIESLTASMRQCGASSSDPRPAVCESSKNCACYSGNGPEGLDDDWACWENPNFWKPQVPNASMALAVALRSDPPADQGSGEAHARWEAAREDAIGLELALHRTYAQHQCLLRALHYLDVSTAAAADASAPDEVCKPPDCFHDPTGFLAADFFHEELFSCDDVGVQKARVPPAARCAAPSTPSLIYPSSSLIVSPVCPSPAPRPPVSLCPSRAAR